MNEDIIVKDYIVAVDTKYEWLPMNICPKNVKIQLLGIGGVATYGTYDGRNRFWLGWAPVPSKPEWMK